MLYADIILPFAGPAFYTYCVPDPLADAIEVGSGVSVQLGVRKIVGGIVRRLHSDTPAYKNIKPVLAVLFPERMVSETQLEMWQWIARYYMCSVGEVLHAALPAMLKPSGFSAEEFAEDTFRPRRVRLVSLASETADGERFNETCEKLRRRAPKQYEALVEMVDASGRASGCVLCDGRAEVPKASLKADATILWALQKKGLIVFSEREISPQEISSTPRLDLPELSDAQKTALDGLRTAFASRDVALLFGVPASDKSEVCFHAIASTLSKGRDVLLLLPEISLTTQFTRRVREVFGERVVLYHSGLSDRRRAEAYIGLMRSKGGSLVVGTRSAVFLPMPRLELVVVDEEQDASYKQQDPAPRYNARDAAIVLARLYGKSNPGVKVILASATPSLETWANAVGGKYGLVRLTQRYGDAPAPRVVISDTIRSAKRGERRSHFNKELSDRIAQTLERGEQVILFQNRRGVAPMVECPDCGFVPRCDHCGIPLTAHRSTLRCHYCGASMPIPSVCPSCGGGNLAMRGFGTEKIEQELAHLFPSARIARLDRDSAGSEKSYSRIIDDFESGATDILVGTQMVTKGLDFAGVSLVGILNADNLVNHPDFRASERAYSLIAQVAGRAGRRSRQGEVVIQTAAPDSSIIARAAAGDYEGMAAEMLAERAMYGYPPYSRLVQVMLRNADRDTVYAAAGKLGEMLRPLVGERLLGPQPPVVEKIKGEYALVYLLKVPRAHSMSEVRDMLEKTIRDLLSESAFKKTTVTFNVDPQ